MYKPEREKEILEFWKENKIFEKSLEQTKGGDPFVFYDGPPFATGLPHFGHILPTTLKDIIPRYMTMKGRFVPRTWGWDCHGLPIENLVEKKLGLKNKKDIEELGVDKFNKEARDSVLHYADEWKKIIPRLGRWIDMEHDYRTMNSSYTESVWWSFKTLYEKGLAYDGYKVMPFCPRCGTTLSNFELNQPGGYKDITDISAYVKFELIDEPDTFLLAWTTTPWTLPGNVALAVGPDIEYVKIKTTNEKEEIVFFVVAKELYEKLKDKFTMSDIVDTFKGSDLIGKSYKPVFDFYEKVNLENKENIWKVYGADFVTTTDGTGIVHIAPAFGEDDLNLGIKENLPFIQHV
ncbi:MAG: class I tRNA ligase family protein, partial [Candidatus Paceibacterota bacterium]